jgi:uncharacterized protein involved in exopolysaccharide biosynthesis/Mrp family chromosome partitioning ATPase
MRVSGVGESSSGAVRNDIDFAAIGRALWLKRRWVIIPALVVAMLATVAVNLVSPRYRSEGRILIEGRENAFLRPEAEKSQQDRTVVDPEAVTSQVQILTSRDLAVQVIRKLKLGDKPEFDPVVGGGSFANAVLSLIGLAKDPFRMSPEERVLQSYFDRLSVVPVEKSRVISIEFQSSDPLLAAQIVDAIADTYMSFQQAAKQQQTRNASQWLAAEIEKMRDRVEAADRKVEEFRSKANLYVGTNNTSLANQQLSDLTTQLAAAKAQKAELEAKARLIREMLKSGKPVESGDITNSELLRRLIEQRVMLRAQLAEQSSTLLDRHPRIQELNAQIGALDAQIRSELEKIVRSIENDARIASARVDQTASALDQLKRQISASSNQDVDLRALEREAKAQRDLLESYLAKYREATARDSLEAAPADARIISRASVSNIPVFPKKTPIVLIATLATMVLVSTFIVTGEFLNGGAMSPASRQQIRDWAGRFKWPGRGKARAAAPQSAAPMSLDELAANVGSTGEAARRIAVFGTARNTGTTYTALGIARHLSRQSRVILVDLALNAPNVSVISSNPGAPGITELMQGTASFSEVITRDRFSRSHLIAVGKAGADEAAILSSPRLLVAIEALARSYDHVVIDAGRISERFVKTFAKLASHAVLVTPDPTGSETAAIRQHLAGAGFADVTIFAGGPPRTGNAQSVAA